MDSGNRADGRMDTKGLSNLLRRCALSFVLLTGTLCPATSWAADAKVKFDLRPDEFPKAILEFYHQSKVEVLFLSTDSLYKIRTQPVYGVLDPREALERMLKGTGLIFEFDTDHSVIIKQPQVASVPEPQMLTPSPAKLPERLSRVAAAPTTVVSDSGPPPEVLITGSLIHTAMDVPAPVQTLSYKDFAAAPFQTVQDTLYQLPINSLSAPRTDLFVNNNYNYGSGIDLRGLGVAATLVLVNGRRQPLSGSDGDFVDVSNIPMAAVERIEILPDGASAQYGSDAIAGVVNIIMKDHFDGAETQVRYGGTPGGRDDLMASQLLGTHWDSGKAMLVYQYENATQLSASSRGYAANTDKRPYGGGDYRSYFTDPGNILSSRMQPIYGIPAGLTAPVTAAGLSSTINLENQYAPYQIFPNITSHSIYATGSQHVSDGIELFAEGRFTQRRTHVQRTPESETLTVPAANPFNPFGATTLVAYNFGNLLGPITLGAVTRNYLGTVGIKFEFGADWHATLSESYGRERLFNDTYNIVDPFILSTVLGRSNPATAFNPFGGAINPATIAEVRNDAVLRAVSAIETTSFVADGPLFDLPAGAVKLAAGLERREESLDHTVANVVNPEETAEARYSRHVGSAFTELLLPLVGDAASPRSPPRLDLNLAARYDDYSDFGHTVNPEFRLRFAPLNWFKWRASWGRSYRAPKLDDLYDSASNVSFISTLADPQSPTKQSTVLAIQGTNSKLQPETAKTWTTGFDVVPTFDPGLKLSLTYYSVDYKGQITTPAASNPFNILIQENQWAAFITRNLSQAQVTAFCNRPDFFGSRASCLASAPGALVDLRLANLAETKLSGLDLDARQVLDTEVGRFDFSFKGSYVFHFDQAVTDASPSFDILNTFENPLKLRFRAVAGWSQYPDEAAGGFGASLAVNFTNGYDNPGSKLLPHIDSLTTLDAQLRFATPDRGDPWGNLEVALNAVNVFNSSPPFADNIYGYDTSNFQALGRVLSLSVRKKW